MQGPDRGPGPSPGLGPGPGPGPGNVAVTVGLDGTVRWWGLRPGDMAAARARMEREDEGEGEEEGKEGVMTAEEERELAELME